MIFLINKNFQKCVEILHTHELEKQIKYIYQLLTDNGGTPEDAILWKYYTTNLAKYWVLSIKEWKKRKDKTLSLKDDIDSYLEELGTHEVRDTVPDFIENHIYEKHLMMSYRAYLLRLNFSYYKEFFPKLAQNLEKYPKGLFYMISNGDPEKDKSNEEWKKILKDNRA